MASGSAVRICGLDWNCAVGAVAGGMGRADGGGVAGLGAAGFGRTTGLGAGWATAGALGAAAEDSGCNSLSFCSKAWRARICASVSARTARGSTAAAQAASKHFEICMEAVLRQNHG